MHREDVQRYLADRQTALEANRCFFEAEHRLGRSDGSYRYIKECSTLGRDDAGNVVSHVAICSDATPLLAQSEGSRREHRNIASSCGKQRSDDLSTRSAYPPVFLD